jgi:hypothetical protein
MLKKLLFVIISGTLVISCSSQITPDNSNTSDIEIEEGDLTQYSITSNVGEKNIDTVIFINASVGARASMTFLNRKGEYIIFGDNISKINFINDETLSGLESLLNKTFVIVFRNLVVKGADSPEFAGDKELNLITGAIQYNQGLDFKYLRSKYKFVEGRFDDYSIGDYVHFEFILKNGESFDFDNCKDEYYDFDYDSESLIGKYFLIFYEDVEINDSDNGPYTSSVIHHLIPLDMKNNKSSSIKEP